jgi:hypothetical protein
VGPGPSAAHAARRRVRAVCHDWPDDAGHTAVLLTSEIVTNAVVHGSGAVTLSLWRHAGWLRVEVGDDGDDMPPVVAERRDGAGPAGQWGLVLTTMLADGWGAEPRHDGRPGKIVWFELSAARGARAWQGLSPDGPDGRDGPDGADE